MSRDLLLYAFGAATLSFIVRNLMLDSQVSVVGVALSQVVILGAMLYALLLLFSKSERWMQAATALYGCSAVIVAIAIPFLGAGGSEALSAESLNLTMSAFFITSIWYFCVIVFILKETLEIKLTVAIVIAVVFEIALAFILLAMFGDGIL